MKYSFSAMRVLAVPATSVLSEHIFSAAGLLLNKLRNRMSSDIVDSIMFIDKNGISNENATETVFNNVIEV